MYRSVVNSKISGRISDCFLHHLDDAVFGVQESAEMLVAGCDGGYRITFGSVVIFFYLYICSYF